MATIYELQRLVAAADAVGDILCDQNSKNDRELQKMLDALYEMINNCYIEQE